MKVKRVKSKDFLRIAEVIRDNKNPIVAYKPKKDTLRIRRD